MRDNLRKFLSIIFTCILTTTAQSGEVLKGDNNEEFAFINSMPIDSFLDILANGLTSMAPMPLDSNLTLMNAVRLKNTLVVNYQFDEIGFKRELLNSTPKMLSQSYLRGMFNSNEYDSFYKDLFWEIQRNGLCSNDGLSLALKRGANVIYSYTDKNNINLFSLAYDKSDCSKAVTSLEILWQEFLTQYMNKYNPY